MPLNFPDWRAPGNFKNNQDEVPDITQLADKKYKKMFFQKRYLFLHSTSAELNILPTMGLMVKYFHNYAKTFAEQPSTPVSKYSKMESIQQST